MIYKVKIILVDGRSAEFYATSTFGTTGYGQLIQWCEHDTNDIITYQTELIEKIVEQEVE